MKSETEQRDVILGRETRTMDQKEKKLLNSKKEGSKRERKKKHIYRYNKMKIKKI